MSVGDRRGQPSSVYFKVGRVALGAAALASPPGGVRQKQVLGIEVWGICVEGPRLPTVAWRHVEGQNDGGLS